MTTKVLDQTIDERFSLYHADAAEALGELPDASVGYSIFSPPFASLFTYSNSDRDAGNCRGPEDFFDHYRFFSREVARVLKPGRLASVHCMLLPTSKARHGHIGLHDFRGDLIRAHQADGLLFHSEVVIWKDPVTAMQRTKALGLLWKQLKKDSAMSRQGVPDYLLTFVKPFVAAGPTSLVTFRKPGENPEPIAHTEDEFPVELWQRYASPVWQDINPSDTLQHHSAREHDDERHICPLQLEVIRRGVRLWSNPGDVVLSPFAGIGSEGYVALQEGRRFVGVELKASYYKQAVLNLRAAQAGARRQTGLFEGASP